MSLLLRIAGTVFAAGMLVTAAAQAQNPYVQEQRKDQVQDRIHDTNQRIGRLGA